jgi:(E)-4-hydroxy-3-methylbut-2-enyl-diphosphate synthase
LKKVPQDQLVDRLFEEIDRSLEAGRTVFEEQESAEGAQWLERIEEENAGELTPERIAALEAKAAMAEATENGTELPMAPAGGAERKQVRLDEEASPTAGRRFTRA